MASTSYTETAQDKQKATDLCKATNQLHDPTYTGTLKLPESYTVKGLFGSSNETEVKKNDKSAESRVDETTTKATRGAVYRDEISARHLLSDAANLDDPTERKAATKAACEAYKDSPEEKPQAAQAAKPREGASLSNLTPLQERIAERNRMLQSN